MYVTQTGEVVDDDGVTHDQMNAVEVNALLSATLTPEAEQTARAYLDSL